MVDTIDAATGAFLGLACGDALGRPVEFHSPERIRQKHGTVTNMLARGTHNKPAGTVTDDTDMALCIARSLVEQGRFDGRDIADRFLEWYNNGPFDIGLMTADALKEYKNGTAWRDAGKVVWERRHEGSNAGNGSVMRCTPHALAFFENLNELEKVSKQSSAITHYDPRCTYGCVLLNRTIAGYLRNETEPLAAGFSLIESDAPDELVEAVRLIPEHIDESMLENSGYVIHTLQTALYDALTAETAEEAIITAVNRGGDTDTVGAVTGALAGARFGAEALPKRWLKHLQYRTDIEQLAKALITTEFRV